MPGLELSGSDTGSVQSVFAALPEGKQKLLSDIHSEINICLDSFKSKNYEIGKLLSKAKRLLPHVSFHKWVEETWSPFDLKPNTAACLKAIYGKWADKPDIVCVLPSACSRK